MPRRKRIAYLASLTLLGFFGAILLASCSTPPEPVTIYQTKEVMVPVVTPCPMPDVPAVEGPDFAPADATLFEAAQYAAARILGLRAENDGLRAAVNACKEEIE